MDDPEKRVAEHLQAAAAAQKRGDNLGEIRLIDSALGLAPDDPHALNARGMRALADSDPRLAHTCFAAAARCDPGQPALLINVATACRALGDDDGERAALDAVLNIDRLHFVAQLRMAELHERLGNKGAAAVSWQGVVQMAAQIDQPPPLVEDALIRGLAYLAAHNAALAALVDSVLDERRTAMGTATRRFDACVDHSLGRRAIYRNDCAGLYFPFLPADEYFERRHFPWLGEIEAKTDVIRTEALAVMATGGDAIRPYVRMDAGSPETKWSGLDGSLDWSACFLWEYGVRNDAVCARCPETAAALAGLPQNHIPGKAPSAFFSVLKPGAHIPAHTGVTNTRAIIHLPLVVPPDCRFRVGGETREWRVGEAFAFDDTIEHEAWNDSREMRIVLIFDVWNPHLSTDEQELLVEFFDVTGQAAEH